MKKTLTLLLISALAVLAITSCSSGEDDVTTTPTVSTVGTTTAATTTQPTTPADPTTPAPTSEPGGTVAAPTAEVEESNLTWVDNNDTVRYEITVNEDGSVGVSYEKEPSSESVDRYGYAGASWANMKADVSDVFDGQKTFVMKVRGEAGQNLMIKPFDDAAYQKTLEFDGTDQTIEINVATVKNTADMVIILFGNGGDPDVTGEFTILASYFVD